MKKILTSFNSLVDTEQLHKKLIFRTRLLTAISLILIAIVGYDIFRYGISIPLSLFIGLVAFILGLFLFSRMNTLEWDEEEAVITSGRMDTIGVAIIILYIGFEVSLRSVVTSQFGDMAGSTGYLFMGIGASLLGRSVGNLISIQKLARNKELI